MILDCLYANEEAGNHIDILTHPGDKGPFDVRTLSKPAQIRVRLVEINDKHRHLTVDEIRVAAKYDVQFVIGSDAHVPEKRSAPLRDRLRVPWKRDWIPRALSISKGYDRSRKALDETDSKRGQGRADRRRCQQEERVKKEMEVVIITGLSGAGKTKAADWFEDKGYYCIDNMPPALIKNFIELALSGAKQVTKVAFVVDVKEDCFFTISRTS